MTYDHLKTFIDGAFDHATEISTDTKGVVRDAVEEVLDLLDKAIEAYQSRERRFGLTGKQVRKLTA